MITTFIVAFIAYVVLDLIWFTFSIGLYKNTVYQVQNSEMNVKVLGAVLAYILMALGVTYFVIPNSNDLNSAILNGALLGLIIYGVFDATNYAIFTNWGVKSSLIDLFWGIFVSSLVSAIVFTVKNN